jgi:hypothetical protein
MQRDAGLGRLSNEATYPAVPRKRNQSSVLDFESGWEWGEGFVPSTA